MAHDGLAGGPFLVQDTLETEDASILIKATEMLCAGGTGCMEGPDGTSPPGTTSGGGKGASCPVAQPITS